MLRFLLVFLAVGMSAAGYGALRASIDSRHEVDATLGVVLLAAGTVWTLALYGIRP